MPKMPLPTPPTGATVATYETYEGAQRAVDFLSDQGFPVQKVTIVGNGLRMVERVTGRLDRNRAAMTGAVGGAWWGLFIGLMIFFFSAETEDGLLIMLAAVIAGAVFGAVMGMIGYSATGGRRDFTSSSSVVASTYDVLCAYQDSDRAISLLSQLEQRGTPA